MKSTHLRNGCPVGAILKQKLGKFQILEHKYTSEEGGLAHVNKISVSFFVVFSFERKNPSLLFLFEKSAHCV